MSENEKQPQTFTFESEDAIPNEFKELAVESESEGKKVYSVSLEQVTETLVKSKGQVKKFRDENIKHREERDAREAEAQRVAKELEESQLADKEKEFVKQKDFQGFAQFIRAQHSEKIQEQSEKINSLQQQLEDYTTGNVINEQLDKVKGLKPGAKQFLEAPFRKAFGVKIEAGQPILYALPGTAEQNPSKWLDNFLNQFPMFKETTGGKNFPQGRVEEGNYIPEGETPQQRIDAMRAKQFGDK